MLKQKIKVLLVEDHKLIQMATKLLVEAAGACVDIASNGSEALHLTQKNCYDIIFMDIGLEDIDGYTVTKKIRAESCKNSDAYIAVVSAHSYDEITVEKQELKLDNYIVKPITHELVQSIFKKFIKTHKNFS